MAANEMSHANQLYVELNNHYFKTVAQAVNRLQPKINRLNRIYMQAQMEVMKEKGFIRMPTALYGLPTEK